MPDLAAPGAVFVPEPIVTSASYRVSCLPPSHHLAPQFTLWVSERAGRYAVTNLWSCCLSVDGRWDHEPRPADRPDGWDVRHRFDLPNALRLAKQAARTLTFQGRSVAQVLADAVGGPGRG